MDEATLHLMEYIKANDLNAVTKAIKEGMDVNRDNSPKCSFLYAAVAAAHIPIIEELLKNGADCNAYSAKGFYPLATATKKGNLQIVKLLVKNGANPNIFNKGQLSPLFISTNRNYEEISKLFLENGANPNFQNKSIPKKNILCNAIDKDNACIVSLLLEKGVNPNEVMPDGDLPLISATQKDHTEIVWELLKGGAEVNAQNSWGFTALQSAFAHDNPEIIIILIAKGASIYTRLNGGDIAFEELKHPYIQELLSNCIKNKILLCDKGSNDEKSCTQHLNSMIISSFLSNINEALGIKSYLEFKLSDIIETTPIQHLIDAISRGDLENVRQFVKPGMDVNSMTEDREIPLIKAIEQNDIESVKLLLENGADPNHSKKPLIKAIEKNDIESVKLLLENGADPNIYYPLEPLPLSLAIETGNNDIAELLLDKGANPNDYTIDTSFPLHLAIEKGDIRILEKLLQLGANINYENNAGDTALRLAFDVKNSEIIILLIANGADTSVKFEGDQTAYDKLKTNESQKLLSDYIEKLLSIDITNLSKEENRFDVINKLVTVKKFLNKTDNVFNNINFIERVNHKLDKLELLISISNSEELEFTTFTLKYMAFKEYLKILPNNEIPKLLNMPLGQVIQKIIEPLQSCIFNESLNTKHADVNHKPCENPSPDEIFISGDNSNIQDAA